MLASFLSRVFCWWGSHRCQVFGVLCPESRGCCEAQAPLHAIVCRAAIVSGSKAVSVQPVFAPTGNPGCAHKQPDLRWVENEIMSTALQVSSSHRSAREDIEFKHHCLAVLPFLPFLNSTVLLLLLMDPLLRHAGCCGGSSRRAMWCTVRS